MSPDPADHSTIGALDAEFEAWLEERALEHPDEPPGWDEHVHAQVARGLDAPPLELEERWIQEAEAGPDLDALYADDVEAKALFKTEQRRLYVRDRLEHEKAARLIRVPSSTGRTLRDVLAAPRPPLTWSVEGLHPEGGNTLLAAEAKAGKTTLGINLARSLADGTPFLGAFRVRTLGRRVGYWNFEVGENQFTNWMERAAIRRPDRIAEPWNLRGYRLPLITPAGEDRAVRWCETNCVECLILDPFSKALAHSGLSENSNDDVGRLLDVLDRIKSRAGLTDLFVLHHYGHGRESARGASVMLGWPDALWNLQRAKNSPERFLKAEGRDVELPESGLHFQPADLRLTLVGGTRTEATQEAGVRNAVKTVAENPGILKSVLIKKMPGDTNHIPAFIADAVAAGYLKVTVEGRSQLHEVTPAGRSYLDGAHQS